MQAFKKKAKLWFGRATPLHSWWLADVGKILALWGKFQSWSEVAWAAMVNNTMLEDPPDFEAKAQAKAVPSLPSPTSLEPQSSS